VFFFYDVADMGNLHAEQQNARVQMGFYSYSVRT